jgi:WD40 repeat protein
MDLASGKTENLLPGQTVLDYDISSDEKEVAFTTTAGDGERQIWLAAFDRRTAPRQIVRGGNSVTFGDKDQLDFLMLEEKVNFLYRIRKDGTERKRLSENPVLNKFGISPDGNWLIVIAAASGDANAATFESIAMPVHGGAPRKICPGPCRVVWSPDGRYFYMSIPGKTIAIPLPAGKSLPDWQPSVINLPDVAKVPGSLLMDHEYISPGAEPSTYVFTKTDLQRNLFQIPLH